MNNEVDTGSWFGLHPMGYTFLVPMLFTTSKVLFIHLKIRSIPTKQEAEVLSFWGIFYIASLLSFDSLVGTNQQFLSFLTQDILNV